MKTYPQEYIDWCRARVDRDVAAFKKVDANQTFETAFFNNMVLLLDYFFVHRLRGVEGKDGNALNEVRVLCSSMLQNKNVMMADKAIKLAPQQSILKYQPGDEIRVKEADFIKLAKAFFAEIERKYR